MKTLLKCDSTLTNEENATTFLSVQIFYIDSVRLLLSIEYTIKAVHML